MSGEEVMLQPICVWLKSSDRFEEKY